MALHIILLILLFIVIGYSIYRKRKTFQSINRLLDCVLSQEPIALSDTKEGELSALVSKINRIQQVLGKQIMQAEDEKEQVKSLVSNMSHHSQFRIIRYHYLMTINTFIECFHY